MESSLKTSVLETASEPLIVIAFSSFIFENVNLACYILVPTCAEECFHTLLYRSLDSNTEFMTFRVRFAFLTSVCQFFPAPAGHRLGDTPLSCFRACTVPQEAPQILPPKTS